MSDKAVKKCMNDDNSYILKVREARGIKKAKHIQNNSIAMDNASLYVSDLHDKIW